MRTLFSKLAYTAALMLALTFTFSCSGDSGGGNSEQSNISSGTEASVESSSSKGTSKSSSSNEVQDNSSSSSLSNTDSSSSNNGNEVAGSVKKDKISGVSQKGPFVKGSTATLYELDEKLVQTGRSFKDIIADDKGSFDIKMNTELVSPYVMLEADGYYRNEVTGNVSTGTIKLYAIADIREKSNVNVNILTHLEYYRVQKLVEGGKSLKDAKKQAQKEILAVFGITGEFKDSEDMSIFGTSDGDAALLAISLLLQGNLAEGQFVERLADFRLGFRETGKWNNKEAKDDMADWASNSGNKKVDYCKYGENSCGIMPTADKCASGKLVKSCFESAELLFTKIRSNILGWNLSSSVPDFEKYVNNYLSSYYGLGTCDAKKAGEIKDGTNDKKYICKDNAWALASELEIKFGLCTKDGEINEVVTVTEEELKSVPPIIDGVIKEDSTTTITKTSITTEYFICKDKDWKKVTQYEINTWIKNGGVCPKEGEIKGIRESQTKYYICKNKSWQIATEDEITDLPYCLYEPTPKYPKNCWLMPTDDNCSGGILAQTCSNPDIEK
ncbi:MAG: hypothetical protein LBC75_13680 [Fibromonadaceae bacterium]|jgi:hypothetical protein|nr:hypothetical protein [Fibromonadaceae bacterium]